MYYSFLQKTASVPQTLGAEVEVFRRSKDNRAVTAVPKAITVLTFSMDKFYLLSHILLA